MQQVIEKSYSSLGRVEFNLNRKISRIIIRMKPFKNISVSVPRGTDIIEAEEFLYHKIDWIQKNKSRIRNFENLVRAEQQNVKEIDEDQAKLQLIKRTEELAAEYNFQINRITVRKQKTRWGSCSFKKNINLNFNLIHLPYNLIDYVIMHELVHTTIHNHSSRFWEELSKYVKDPEKKSRSLKKYQYLLYMSKNKE
jgi:predicted metal-dependent hydrolase